MPGRRELSLNKKDIEHPGIPGQGTELFPQMSGHYHNHPRNVGK